MSGTQVSSAPNVLFNAPAAYDAASTYQHNQLLNTEAQQNIAATDMEQVGRAASWIDTLQPEQKPQAYQAARAQLQSAGFAKNAPAEYPGDQAITMLARQSLPVVDQYKLGIVTPPGTTAAINAALVGGNPPAQGGQGNQPPVTSAAPSGTIEPAALTNANAVRDGLIKRGMDPDTATAFAANALHESVANPNTGPGDGGASHGLFQWNGDRAAGFQAIYGHSPDNAPLDEQLDYVMHELNGPESLAKGRIAQAQGVDGKAAEVSQAYLRPKDVVPEMQRRSATALQLQRQNAQPGQGGQATTTTAAAPAAAGPVTVGDSLASPGGLGGSGVVGASPSAVRAQIAQGVQNGAYTGKDVVLSSGASNAPGDMENVEAQLKQLRDASSVTLLGVGPAIEAKNPGTNAKLATLAAQYGAKFQPLPGDQMSPDGVHPNAAGYATLKTATAPPGAAPQGGRYQVASNAPVGPPSTTAAAPGAATGTPPATAQPPAQPAGPQANLPHSSEVPTGVNSPQYQQAMDLQRRAMLLDAQPDPTGRLKTLAAGLRSQAALILQSDSVVNTQEGQLHTMTGKIDDPAHPNANYVWDATKGSYIDTTGTHPPVTPPSPRFSPPTVDPATGKPAIAAIGGEGGPKYLPIPERPATGPYELQKDLYQKDTEKLPEYNTQNQQAAANLIRIQQMRELVDQVSSGAGGAERANWANIADTMGWHDLATKLVGMGGAAAAQEFAKYGLATAGAQERGDLGARGSIGAINLYKSANPGLELQPDANKKMLTAQLVAAQANRDYTQQAMDYVNSNGGQFIRGGAYTPLSHFDAEWAAARNPQIYAAAMGAINGDPWQKWTKALNMKSPDDVQRVIDIVRRADPTSTIMWNNGEPHAVGTGQ